MQSFPTVRRSKFEIEIDILRAISQGTGRLTRVMYRSNLTWNAMLRLVRNLESLGVIASSSERKNFYVVTDKGARVLRNYDSIRFQLEKL